MTELTFNWVRKYMKNSFELHRKMVEMALEKGVSRTAVAFGTTRKTVYKWLKRYYAEGFEGLKERSRAPKHHPRQIPQQFVERILAIRRQRPYLGPFRIKEEYQLPCSASTIYRVLKRHGMIRPRKRAHQVKRDLRAVKRRLKAFEKIQIDVKELNDIPNYYPYYLKGWPRYQVTARDVRTGACFISFAHENTTTNTAIFANLLLAHLKSCGVELSYTHIQTDNGSEFVRPFNAKNPYGAFKPTLFQQTLQRWKVEHVRIPPGAKTFNSDVETFHRIIEDEFYDFEAYNSKKQLLEKSYTYMLYFNLMRKNRYKDKQAPADILKKLIPKLNVAKLFQFKPVVLDNYFKLLLNSNKDTVYYDMKSDTTHARS